jgi:hypothetical protein
MLFTVGSLSVPVPFVHHGASVKIGVSARTFPRPPPPPSIDMLSNNLTPVFNELLDKVENIGVKKFKTRNYWVLYTIVRTLSKFNTVTNITLHLVLKPTDQ